MDQIIAASIPAVSPVAPLAAVPLGHLARALSPTTPGENRLLSLYRIRNGLLDRIFYNVEPRDQAQVVAADHDQGSIIVVHPDPELPLRYFRDPVEFLTDDIARTVEGIALSGVGSSAIGAVGLARDLAAARGVCVAAIVSGYGLDDVVYEGAGGWLCLRETNRLEFAAQQGVNLSAMLSHLPLVRTQLSLIDSMGAGPDLFTLKCLLRPKRMPQLRWLLGHSKGNLLISSAISELVMEGADLASSLADTDIVFFGALSALPEGVGKQHQIIGAMDGLGWMNSRLNLAHKLVPGAMHHLNPQIAFAMPARQELRQI